MFIISNLKDIWNSRIEEQWKRAELAYWDDDSVKRNLIIEKKLDDSEYVIEQIKKRFFSFLTEEFCTWKYTDCRWRNQSLSLLRKMTEEEKLAASEAVSKYLDFLQKEVDIKGYISKAEIKEGLKVSQCLNGIGVSGMSGILSLAYPRYFGTIDVFVAKAINSFIPGFIKRPGNLTFIDVLNAETLLQDKAQDLNRGFATNYWTARGVEKALWVLEKSREKGKDCIKT